MKTLWERILQVGSFLIPIIMLFSMVPNGEGRALMTELQNIPTYDLDTKNLTSDLNYRLYLFLAQEEAKCLWDYGGHGGDEGTEEPPPGRKKQDQFINSKCVKTRTTYAQCLHCRRLTESIPTVSRCQELCKSDNACSLKCSWLRQRIEELKDSGIGPEDEEGFDSPGISIQPPEVFCEDMSLRGKNPKFHIVVLKWTLEVQRTNQTERANMFTPIVFVLERVDVKSEDPRWETRGKTLTLIQSVNSPYESRTYRYRVTAVGPEGPLGRSTSKEISTHDGFTTAGRPKRIYKLKEVVHDNSLDILIGWEPSDDKPCDYKVIQNRQDGEGKSVSHRFTATSLENGLQVWFYDLKFKETYDVGITSRRANWDGFESDLKSQTFTMPTCLEAHNHRFDKCVPSPPRNLSHELVLVVDEKKEGVGHGNIKVKWTAPLYTSAQNKLKSYSLILGKSENAKGLNNQSMTPHSAFGIAALTNPEATFNIPGDVTEYFIKNVTLNRRYPIALIATSVKGDSSPAYFTLHTTTVKEDEGRSIVTSWIYLSIPISLMILGIFSCHILRVLVQKRQVKQARNQYFQSMDERESPDWSIVPLNEDSPTLKFLSDGPKEKWEISYDSLIMGEVIGQGAFGVVRRAKMIRKKGGMCGGPKYSVLPGNNVLDENGMETVAVKMLKVSATRDDRDQLIKEIVTMQHLGGHPQIVSLLGACTKGRSLCLVLEFCPGGDLLSFLRKVRAKYWPTLGLSNSHQSWSEKSLEKQRRARKTASVESGCTSGDTYNSSENSSINYADMEVSATELSTSTGKITSPPNTVINHQYGKMPLIEPEEDDCRPIDEKDILSYARQIAMGMEFLEKNRVVHRDLAGRNVLILGDYKQVKISDFGLSRDIYTWNVYHQKSNGKLPIKWMAIESIFTHVFTSKSDVWSFGILLWELVTLGGTPYPGLGNTELFHLLKSGYRMERPDNCSEELYALMKKCWRTSPVSRPNFTELRRFLETMIEAAEPSLYLSLMADIPVDYFHLSSRSDLLHLKLEDDSPLRESATGPSNSSTNRQWNGSTNNYPNLHSNGIRKPRPKYSSQTPPTFKTSPLGVTPSLPTWTDNSDLPTIPTAQSNETPLDDESVVNEAEGTQQPLLHHPSPICKRSHQSRFKSSGSVKSIDGIPRNDSALEMKGPFSKGSQSSDSLVSPDSGFPRCEVGGRDYPSSWSDNENESSVPLNPQSVMIPLQNLKSIK